MDFHQFSTNPLIFLGYFIFLTINPISKMAAGVFGGFLGVNHGGDWIQEYPNTPKMSKQKRFRKAILPRVDDYYC